LKPETRKSRPLLLGHRGARLKTRSGLSARQNIPAENTLDAFKYAMAHGCDGFEFDVRATRDARQVIWHDPKLEHLRIAASSYGDLCSARVEPLACLEHVLEQFANGAFLDIELKVAGGESSVIEAVRKFPPVGGYVLSSFLPEVLARLHELDPSLPLGYICDRAPDVQRWRTLPISFFIPQYHLVTEGLVAEVRAQGAKLFTWTVNSPPLILRLAEWGVDGLISDDPDLLSKTFAGVAQPKPTN
jgi:glycerophosphoryl diester phosphodiesterase